MSTFWTILTVVLGFILFFWLVSQFRFTVVRDHEAGLRIRSGRFVRQLGAGRHLSLFGLSEIQVFDLRWKTLLVTSQEISTADRVPVKTSLAATYHIADPRQALMRSVDLEKELHLRAQLALRGVVARYQVEELLEKRGEAGEKVAEALREEIEGYGVKLVSAAVRDLSLGRDLKHAMSDVVRARAEASARLERARGEAAALRSLANAARLFDEHRGLYRMRLLQAAEAAAGGERNTLVLGLDRLADDALAARRGE